MSQERNPKKIVFWTIDKDGNTFLLDSDFLKVCAEELNHVEAMTEADIEAEYGVTATKRTIILKPNTYRLKHEIARLSQRDDETLGRVHDPELVQAARAAAVVESWNLDDAEGQPAGISVEGFQNLHENVAQYVDFHIYDYLCADIRRDPSFLGVLANRPQRTDSKPETPASLPTTAAKDSSPTSTGTATSQAS